MYWFEGNKTEKERSQSFKWTQFKCEMLSFDPSSQAVIYSLTQLHQRALAMTTATSRKTSHENKPLTSRLFCGCSYSTMLAKYAKTRLVCALLNYIKGMKDLQLYAQVVFHNQNLVTLRCCFEEDVTELFQSSCRTCSTLIWPHSTNQILNLWRCR